MAMQPTGTPCESLLLLAEQDRSPIYLSLLPREVRTLVDLYRRSPTWHFRGVLAPFICLPKRNLPADQQLFTPCLVLKRNGAYAMTVCLGTKKVAICASVSCACVG